MFTPAEFQEKLPTLLALLYVPHQVSDFSFGEEYMEVYRAPKQLFQSDLHFLANALSRVEPSNRPLGRQFCFLFKEDFYARITAIPRAWLWPHTLPPRAEFVGAIQLDGDWNESFTIAEFEQEYMFVYWTTGA